jgi:flagellum-specific peptidoglycan hydrolase FlgJ
VSALIANLKTGIPAPVLLGQTIQETGGCGSSEADSILWSGARNFHGIKFQSGISTSENMPEWSGKHCSKRSPENSGNSSEVSDFLVFDHPDFGFLTAGRRYRFLMNARGYEKYLVLVDKMFDPIKFASELGGANYIWAWDSRYGTDVVKHIEDYDLMDYSLSEIEMHSLSDL